MDIRSYIRSNFEGSDETEIRKAIEDNVKANEEVALPGMGVFFETLWNNCDNHFKEEILNILSRNFK